MPHPPANDQDDVIIEVQSRGSILRVTALDPTSLVEVVIQGPASAGREAIVQAALKKLAYVLAKNDKRRR